jgi:hypothetical protein
MRNRLPIGLTTGAAALAAAVAHLWGLWSPSRTVAMAGGTVLFAALAALAVLAATARRDATAGPDATATADATARRVATVLLATGLLALAAAMGTGAVWYLPREAVADFGWFGYGPQPANVTATLVSTVDASIARQRWYGLVALLAVGCLAAAVVKRGRGTGEPRTGQRRTGQTRTGPGWSAGLIAVAGVIGAGWLGWDLWSVARSFTGHLTGHLVDILADTWPQLLTVPLAAGAAALTVRRRSPHGRWAAGASATGLAAFAIPAALAAHTIAKSLTSRWLEAQFAADRPGNTAAVQLVVVPDHAVHPVGTPGLVAGCATVAGAILLLAGWPGRPRSVARAPGT